MGREIARLGGGSSAAGTAGSWKRPAGEPPEGGRAASGSCREGGEGNRWLTERMRSRICRAAPRLRDESDAWIFLPMDSARCWDRLDRRVRGQGTRVSAFHSARDSAADRRDGARGGLESRRRGEVESCVSFARSPIEAYEQPLVLSIRGGRAPRPAPTARGARRGFLVVS